MTATTASCSTSPSETPPSDTVLQGLRRTVSSPFEHALVTAMQAAQWKARSETSETRGADPSELAVGTGIEIERRCRVFDTPVDVTVCTGTVAPTASARMAIFFQGENPAVYGGREADNSLTFHRRLQSEYPTTANLY